MLRSIVDREICHGGEPGPQTAGDKEVLPSKQNEGHQKQIFCSFLFLSIGSDHFEG